MTSLLNSSYTQLNDLISINSDDIQTESISTNSLILGGSVFNPNDYITSSTLSNYVLITSLNDTLLYYITSSQLNNILSSYATNSQLSITNQDIEFLQTDVAILQTILTGCSYDGVYNFLNLSNNLHVYGSLFIGNNIDVNSIISGLPSTYASIATLNNYALTSSLSNYVLTTSLNTKLNDYVLTTAMNTKLNDYVLTTAMNTKLNDYVLTTAMNTKLNDYVLSTVLNSYITSTSLNNILLNYITLANLTNKLADYCTTGSYNTLKTKVDTIETKTNDNSTWIATNSVAVLAAVVTVGDLVLADIGQTALNATFSTVIKNDEQDGYISLLQAKTTQISYSTATTTTNIGGAQLTCPALSATSISSSSITNVGSLNSGTITCSGSISSTSTIVASGNITTSSGTIITGTLNTNTINTKSGSTLNIGNAATTINMGSSSLGNTINVGNLLSTINLNGDVNFTSNNPFNMFNSYFQQF